MLSGRTEYAILQSVRRHYCSNDDALFILAERHTKGFDKKICAAGSAGYMPGPSLKCSPGVQEWINLFHIDSNGENGFGL